MAARNATADDLPDEFDAVEPALVASALAQAIARNAVGVCGEITSELQALLAAHILKDAGLGSSSAPQGPVRSRRVGDVSEDYAVAAPASVLGGGMASTAYGRQYLALRATVVTAGAWVAASAWRSW